MTPIRAPERGLSFDLDASIFICPGIPRPVGLTGLAVDCESPNKVAVAGGAGCVGTVEEAGSAGMSLGFSVFFFRSSTFFFISS